MIVKVCGLREPENIAELGRLPIDWMGFIFYPKSKRFIHNYEALATWLKEDTVGLSTQKRVGVFVNAELENMLNAVHDFQLDLVQLHGEESPSYCRELQLIWQRSSARSAQIIKAFRVGPGFDFASTKEYAAVCDYFLFDTKGEAHGGTGKKFDWDLLDAYAGPVPFLMSGGIGPEDAAEVAAFQHPFLYGIDLNSRFERVPAYKETSALETFFADFKSALNHEK